MNATSLSIALAGLVAAAPGAPGPVPALLPAAPAATSAPYVAGELLVKFKSGIAVRARRAAVAARGHSVLASLGQPGWVLVGAAAGQSVDEAIAAYRSDPAVELAQPNYVYRIAAAPNDPLYGQLWAARNIGQAVGGYTQPPGSPLSYPTGNPGTAGDDMNLEKAWDHVTDCSSVVVAVIDSGVNYSHQELAGNMWNGGTSYPNHGWDFVRNGNDPMDFNGHGTHVAGTIGALGNNGIGVAGVCWKASIMAVRTMNAMGQGSTATIMQGIDFAVTHGAKVINMSLGGGGAFDTAFSNSISTAQAADVVVVVAAGNDGTNNETTPVYPCSFTQPNLICVAALDQSYQLATFSNYGTTSVDVGAPGTNIVSTWAGTNTVISDSFATGWFVTVGGWAPTSLMVGSTPTPFLVDPGTYPSGTYGVGVDDRVWKTFDLSALNASVAALQFAAAVNVINGDYFRAAWASTAVDPFAGTGTIVLSQTNAATYPKLPTQTADVTGCIGATCTIGFQLASGAATPKDLGDAVGFFGIKTLTVDQTSYNTINGTSMATPQVAGVVALLRAYNPQYTYADVVTAIESAGRPVAALATKTSTGHAVDAMASLAYIATPTGLAAQVK